MKEFALGSIGLVVYWLGYTFIIKPILRRTQPRDRKPAELSKADLKKVFDESRKGD